MRVQTGVQQRDEAFDRTSGAERLDNMRDSKRGFPFRFFTGGACPLFMNFADPAGAFGVESCGCCPLEIVESGRRIQRQEQCADVVRRGGEFLAMAGFMKRQRIGMVDHVVGESGFFSGLFQQFGGPNIIAGMERFKSFRKLRNLLGCAALARRMMGLSAAFQSGFLFGAIDSTVFENFVFGGHNIFRLLIIIPRGSE